MQALHRPPRYALLRPHHRPVSSVSPRSPRSPVNPAHGADVGTPGDTYPEHIEHGIVNVGEQRLYAASAGPARGPLVLLLHGFPEMSYAWRRQMGPLAAAGFRVVAPDQRGYGWSSKPQGRAAYTLDLLAADMVGLAQALGHERASVVGHDWGGLVAWTLATRHSAFCERVAILNAPHPATLLPEMLSRPVQVLKSAYIGLFQLPWLPETLLAAHDHRLLEKTLTEHSREGTFSAAELAVYHQAWAMPGALTAMLDWYRALTLPRAPPSSRAAASETPPVTVPVTMPVRVIWGDRDRALNASLAERAMAHCLQGEVIHLEHAGHWLHHEEPERVNALLLQFLLAPGAAGLA